MDLSNIKKPVSHGSGQFDSSNFKKFGENNVIEDGVLIFHPENISIGNNIYIGHNTIIKGYYNNEMIIGDGTWIGQGCFFHSGGGLIIGKSVGIGPLVKIFTSYHKEKELNIPLLHNPLEFCKVEIHDGADIGIGSIIL